MTWNRLRAYPGEKLTRIMNWEQRGLAYWQTRVQVCEDRITNADSGTQLGRAINDRDIALEAVRRLSA